MFKDLNGKVAIVTGAGQGIGESIAKAFAAAGAKVVVATRTRENGQKTVDDILLEGGEAILIQADIGLKTEVQRVVEETSSHFRRIDIVIHNAAVFPVASITELRDDELEAALSVNLKAAFWLMQSAVPLMKKQVGGRLIITSSVTGPTVAMPEWSAYAASKGAVNAFIRTAALEFARDGITVNGVEPGFILTPALSLVASKAELSEIASMIPEGSLGTPDHIANTMLFLASEEARYITGQTIIVDGGSTLPESPVQLRAYYDKLGK